MGRKAVRRSQPERAGLYRGKHRASPEDRSGKGGRAAEINRQQELVEAATKLAMVKQEQAQQAIKIERGLDLTQRGWGAIFAQDSKSNTSALLQKLLAHRRKGGGSKYLELTYRPEAVGRWVYGA